MPTAATVPMAARRWEPCVRTIRIRGLDLTPIVNKVATGAQDLLMQVRMAPDTPGTPLVNLPLVATTNTEGLRVTGVSIENGVPVSTIEIRINETTMEGLPFSGELGDPSFFYYGLQVTFASLKKTRMEGAFIVLPGAVGSDAAPLNRPASYGSAATTPQPWSTANLTIAGDEVTVLEIDGAAEVGLFISQASDFAASAQTSATLAQDIAGVTAAGDLTPNDLTSAVTDARMYGPGTPTSTGGALFSASVRLAGAGTGYLQAYWAGSDGKHYLVWQSGLLNVGSSGVGTFKAGTHFAAPVLQAGVYVGWAWASGARIRYKSGGNHYEALGTAFLGSPSSATPAPGVKSDTVAFSFAIVPYPAYQAANIDRLASALENALPLERSFGGAVSTFAFDPNPLAAGTWIHGQTARRGGIIRSFKVNLKAAGAFDYGFMSRNADGTFKIEQMFTYVAAGNGVISLVPDVDFPTFDVKPGWYPFVSGGAIFGGSTLGWSYLSQAGLASNKSYLSAGALQFNVRTAGALTLGPTPSIGYEIDARPFIVERRHLTRNRVRLWGTTFASASDYERWSTNGSGWTISAAGAASPNTTAPAYNNYLVTHRWNRLERRLSRVNFQIGSTSAIVGVGFLGAEDGSQYASSLFTLDGTAGRLCIKNNPGASPAAADPGTVAFTALPVGFLNTAHRYRMDIYWTVRAMRIVCLNLTTGVSVEVSYDEDAAGLNNYGPAGNCNNYLTLFAPGGQWTCTGIEVFYNRPAPRIMALGDSKTQNDKIPAAQGWARKLDAQLTALGIGEVAISAQGGARALGAYYTAAEELPALRPNWLILPVGTNDTDSNLAAAQVFIEETIRIAKSCGSKVVLATLLTTSKGTFTNFNAYVQSLAAADPTNIKVWRWDLAESVGADGTTLNTAFFVDPATDPQHRNDAGETAVLNRLLVDVPEIWD